MCYTNNNIVWFYEANIGTMTIRITIEWQTDNFFINHVFISLTTNKKNY